MLDAVSYLAVVWSLLAMRKLRMEQRTGGASVLEEFKEGLRYVSRFPPARAVLLLLALIAIMGTPYRVLMPAIAELVYHGGPHTFGALMTATGVGAVLGAAWLAARPSVRGLWRVLGRSAAVFGAALVLFALSHSFVVSLVLLALVGAGMMIAMASVNTILQTIVEQRLRGRVMAFYAVAFLGTAPIGSLLAGVLADHIGAPMTILLGGVACLVGAIVFRLALPGLRPHIREVYAERGV
jgi:MFS family permease